MFATRSVSLSIRPSSRSFSTPGKSVLSENQALRNLEGKSVPVKDIFAGKKVIVFGVPGAYTPVCSNKHVPGFLELADKFKAKGVSSVACVSVNDHFVMKNWAQTFPEAKNIEFLADPDGSFTKQLGVDIDLSAAGLGVRSKRYAMLVDNGIIKDISVEKSPADHSVSSASEFLNKL